MKRFQFSSLVLVLLVLLFAAACSDSTAPSHHALVVKAPSPVQYGNDPPPPVDAAVTITISSIQFSGAFTGTYFSNGSLIQSTVAASEIGDESLTFSGTAWLRLDKTQPFGSSASANARFQVTDQKFFGNGTLYILGHTVRIDQVTSFTANPQCDTAGELCALITFDATVDGESGHHGTAEAFDRQFCTLVQTPLTPPTFDAVITLQPGSSYYYCPAPEVIG